MSVLVRVRGGISREIVVSAIVEGAEFNTPEYFAHYGCYESYVEDGASLREGYEMVVAEAGLTGFAPAFEALPNIRGWVREIDIMVEVA